MAKLKPTFKIHYRGLPKLEKRLENFMVKDTMYRIGEWWWQDMMPKHFTAEGARKYHYQPRKTKNVFTGQPKLARSGRALAPSGLPIVWHGDTRREAKNKRITSTFKKATVTLQVRNLNRYRPKGNKKLNMAQEVRTVLKSELRDLEKRGKKYLEDRLKAHSVRATVTIR